MLPQETGVWVEKRGADEYELRVFLRGSQCVFTVMAHLGSVDGCALLKVGSVSRIPVASLFINLVHVSELQRLHSLRLKGTCQSRRMCERICWRGGLLNLKCACFNVADRCACSLGVACVSPMVHSIIKDQANSFERLLSRSFCTCVLQ